jgi:hypothetical protein
MLDFRRQDPDAAALYSFARVKVPLAVPLRFVKARYDFERDWYEVDCDLYDPVIVGAEEVADSRVRLPAFARQFRRGL